MRAKPRKRVHFVPFQKDNTPLRLQRLRRLAARGVVNGKGVRELTGPEFSTVGMHSFVVENGSRRNYHNFSSYKWPEHDQEHGVIFAMQDRAHFYPKPYSFWSMLVDHGMATRIGTTPRVANSDLSIWRRTIMGGGIDSAGAIRGMTSALSVHFGSTSSFQRGVNALFKNPAMRPHLDFLGNLDLPAHTLYARFPPERVKEATPHLIAIFDFLSQKKRMKSGQ